MLVGDPAQLPPVAAVPIYESGKGYGASGHAAYLNSFTRVIDLKIIQRQQVVQGDDEQAKFVGLLNRLRDCESTQEDYWLLMQRTPRQLGTTLA